MKRFHLDMLKGNRMKDLVKVLLESSGYSVLPYGYEGPFSEIKRKLNEKGTKNSKTVRRIRSSPDLLVYDDLKKDLMLVEVKMRNAPEETKVTLYRNVLRTRYFKEFWGDAILVLVVPCGNVFYAQKVSEIEIKQDYNLAKDFERFEDIFTRTKVEEVSKFETEALHIIAS